MADEASPGASFLRVVFMHQVRYRGTQHSRKPLHNCWLGSGLQTLGDSGWGGGVTGLDPSRVLSVRSGHLKEPPMRTTKVVLPFPPPPLGTLTWLFCRLGGAGGAASGIQRLHGDQDCGRRWEYSGDCVGHHLRDVVIVHPAVEVRTLLFSWLFQTVAGLEGWGREKG